MIYTSTELFNAFLEDTRQIMVKVTIGNRVFDNDNIATLNLEYGSMDGGSLDIGGAFANSLKIGFSELVEGLKELDEIEIELGAVLPDETIEYVKMGTFIINEEVMMDRNNNTTSIDAMDRMVMLGEIYEPTLEGDYARIIDIAVDIANQAGVVVSNDFDRLRTDSIQIPREKTLREAIGIIAQFEVGFATFNRDGELAIRKLNDPNFNITPEDYTMKGLVKNEVPFRLNGAQCQVGDSEEDALQTGASTGTQIILNNPSMTQEHLDRIYTELSTLNYYPFSLEWYGHPALEAGDWIEIEDLQGNKFKTPNLHYSLDFNGGLKAKSQAETTSSSEVVYQYKSPLQQEIQAIAARLSATGGNHVYDDLTEPENPKEGDLWFKPEGPDTLILKYTRLEDGTLDWVEELNTGDTTKNADAIAEQQQEIEEAKQTADEAVDSINTAVASAGFTSLDETISNVRGIASGVKSELDIAIENAGFTSLDETLQNMNYITMEAEGNAQQAITDASNAYGLAQTSISEAQTAQANSLTALGKADNALVGVSSLNVRVDDVEAELELKADNTFMNEDGTLTTLSNAITFNAYRFSSDMSRIESRVESLAGEINLVILRGSIENRLLYGSEVFPNAPSYSASTNVMGELIDVVGGESFALSKELTGADDRWRIVFFDENHNYISRFHPPANTQDIMDAPPNARYMWVSYPQNSKPQIVRGTDFIPYRPNMADQMTTEEVVMFRNEYDEFADKTERRLTSIDSTGGRLEIAEALITQTANGLQTTVGKVDSQGSRLSTVEQTANGLQSSVYNSDGSSKITQLATAVNSVVSDFTEAEKGSENLLPKTNFEDGLLPSLGSYNVDLAIVDVENPHGQTSKVLRMNTLNDSHYLRFQDVALDMDETYTFSMWVKRVSGGYYSGSNIGIGTDWDTEYFGVTGNNWTKIEVTGKPGKNFNFIQIRTGNQDVDLYIYRPKLEIGEKATRWSPGLKDIASQSQISQLSDSITQSVSDLDGRVTAQKQTLDSISSTVSGHGNRISTVEQTASGLQSTVADKASQTEVTQLANGFNVLVSDFEDYQDGLLNILTHNESDWELGGFNLGDGSEVPGNIRFRTKSFIPISGANYVSLDSTGYGEFMLLFYDKNKSYLGTTKSSWDNVRFGTYEVPSGTKYFRAYGRSADDRSFSSIEDANIGRWSKAMVVKGAEIVSIDKFKEPSPLVQSQLSVLNDNINLRVTKGDLLSQINIEADRMLFQSDKILMDANNVVFTGKAWIPNSVIGDLEADKITSGKLDAGQITVVNLDVSSLSGNTAEFITASFNGINSSTQIDADGIYMSGSGFWRRTYLSATGFDLYNGSGGSNKSGAIGYFKEHYDNTTSAENYFATTKGSKHYIGIGANNTHHIAFGYQDDFSITRKYTKALQIDGDTGRIRVYSSLSSKGSNYELNLAAYDDYPYGIAWERSNSGIMFASNGTKIWDESAKAWDDYDMTTRRKIGFYGDSGVQVLTTNKNMEIWTGGSTISFYTSTNSQKFRISDGSITAYADLNMSNYKIINQSDSRLKTNVTKTNDDSLEKIINIEFVDFNWLSSGEDDFGIIAQQVQRVVPELISEGEDGYLGINNTRLNMMTVHAVKELALRELNTNKIASQALQSTETNTQKIERLEKRIEELESVM